MKRFLVIIAAFLISCSNCNSATQTEPNQPTVDAGPEVVDAEPEVADTGPHSVTTTSAESLQVIDWKTSDELMALAQVYPELCVMAYFPNPLVETEMDVLKDQRLILFINKAFMSIRLPITKENAESAMEDFQLNQLPALIFAPADDSLVLQVDGNIEPGPLYDALDADSKAEGIFVNCVAAKAKTVSGF